MMVSFPIKVSPKEMFTSKPLVLKVIYKGMVDGNPNGKKEVPKETFKAR